jgi:hypothetical protein
MNAQIDNTYAEDEALISYLIDQGKYVGHDDNYGTVSANEICGWVAVTVEAGDTNKN